MVVKNHVTLWGQVGTTSGVTIGEKAVVLAKSGVSKDFEGGKTYFGIIGQEYREKLREMAFIKKLMNDEKKK